MSVFVHYVYAGGRFVPEVFARVKELACINAGSQKARLFPFRKTHFVMHLAGCGKNLKAAPFHPKKKP